MKRTSMFAGVALALLSGLTLGLSGCNDGGVRTVKGDWYAYHQDYLRYAAGRGPIQTVVRGNAFNNVSPGTFTDTVISEMQDQPLGVGEVSFEPAEPSDLKGPVYVSLVFNPESGFGSYDACRRERVASAGGGPKPGEAARVVAAFCSTQKLLSGTEGVVSLSGPNDPKFGELIRYVMIDLFPLSNPNLGPSCDSCP